MAYREEKQVRLKRQVSKQAITLAMQSRWQESIDINKRLIASFPNDVEAYNRLGKAYLELGEYDQAKEAYTKAAELDQYNLIARKNLQRLAVLSEAAETKEKSDKAEPQIFIEETGKAAVLNLYQLAAPAILVKMVAGDKVYLKTYDTTLAVENGVGERLGLVPAKYAQRLIKLMEGKNKYTTAIINSSEHSLSVIIRETHQDPSMVGQVSFPSRRIEELPPYVGEQIFRSELEEEEEGGEGLAAEEELETAELVEETEDKDEIGTGGLA